MSRSSTAARLSDAAPVFAALGDTTRLRLVTRLGTEGPLSIARLSDDADVTRQAITKHLDALAQAGLVRDSRVGRERIWSLETKRLAVARAALDDVAKQWDSALHRLKKFVEKNP